MTLSNDWVIKNWDFLKARNKITFTKEQVVDMLSNQMTPLRGKFYGTEDLWDRYQTFGKVTNTGTKALFLHPYIITQMPEGVEAIYVDIKRYKFDREGNIAGLAQAFEVPIIVIMR